MDKPFNSIDDDDDDCRTDATTVRASNVQSSPSMDNNNNNDGGYRAHLERILTDVLNHCPHSDDRNTMVSFLMTSFWRLEGEERLVTLRTQYAASTRHVIPNSLLDALLEISNRPAWMSTFREILNTINLNIRFAETNEVHIDPNSDLSDNAGSGSARVQGSPLAAAGSDSVDSSLMSVDVAAVRRGPRQVVQQANAQDAGNPSMIRNTGVLNLAAAAAFQAGVAPALLPSQQPAGAVNAAPIASVPPDQQQPPGAPGAAVVSPTQQPVAAGNALAAPALLPNQQPAGAAVDTALIAAAPPNQQQPPGAPVAAVVPPTQQLAAAGNALAAPALLPNQQPAGAAVDAAPAAAAPPDQQPPATAGTDGVCCPCWWRQPARSSIFL